MAVELQSSLDRLAEIESVYVDRISALLVVGVDLAVDNIDELGYIYPDSYIRTFTTGMSDLWHDSAKISEELFPAHVTKSVKADIIPVLTRFTESFSGNRAARILATTQNTVRDKVIRGLARGQSRDALIRQILNESPAISRARAVTIVQTESHMMAQYTSQALAENSGLILIKRWNSILDDRTRTFDIGFRVSEFNHRVMHGQTRPLLDTYSVPNRNGSFEQLYHPGDPAGSAGNIINCRCMQTYEDVLR